MRLSVLDQSPVPEGSTPAPTRWPTRSTSRAAPTRSATTATGSPSTTAAACSPARRPEVLIGPIAAATSRIRVGCGGVMLPHYSPFKVAEVVRLLAGLHPGRIDLGIGRAAGTDPLTTFALQRDRRQAAPDDFPRPARRAARLPRTARSRTTTRSTASRLPDPETARTSGCSARRRRSAIWADAARPRLRVRRLHQPRRARDLGARHSAAATPSPSGRWPPTPRRRPSGSLVLARDAARAAPRQPDPGPAAGEGARSTSARCRRLHQSGGRRAVLGTPEQVRAGLEEVAERLRRRRGHHRHDLPRPRRARPLLRADRRGVRAHAAEPSRLRRRIGAVVANAAPTRRVSDRSRPRPRDRAQHRMATVTKLLQAPRDPLCSNAPPKSAPRLGAPHGRRVVDRSP